MHSQTRRFGALGGALAILLAACGGGSVTAPPLGSAPASAASSQAAVATPGGAPVEIRWYCCLGTGETPPLTKVENKVVADFNAAHPNIHVTFEVVTYEGNAANDTLANELLNKNGPDVVGPVGIGGANAFNGQWLDLTDEIAKTNYDLSGFPSSVVDIYKVGGQGQVGIPFAVYPSVLFYRKSLFEEAKLAEPPHKYGDKYTLDGQQVDWSYDTVREIAKRLTVDKAGKDAAEAGFDKTKIAQWGFEPQRDDLRSTGSYFGGGQLAGGPDGKTATVPEPWKAAWKAFYNGIHVDHTDLTESQFQSKDINPNDYPFFTGNLAMSTNFLWSTYGLGPPDEKTPPLFDDWDMAAVPSYNGTYTSSLNADTFRILKSTKHPDEAFTFLQYLLGDAAQELQAAYGAFPARSADQAAGIQALKDQFPNDPTVDWQVAVDSLQYPDNPNSESFMPAYNETLGLIGSGGKYLTRWGKVDGLNMDTEIENLTKEIQAIWDRSG
jgi:multiple sugar transport system substrate-binding protein